MELEELKNGWSMLGERLTKLRQTNEDALQLLLKKQNKSLWEKLINFEFRHILFISALCIFISFNRKIFEMQTHGTDLLIITYILFGIAFINRSSKIIFLRRNDPNRQSIVKTLKRIAILRKWIQIEYIAASIMTSCVTILTLRWFTSKDTGLRYVLICVFLFCIGFIAWSVFHFYRKNIREIQQNLKNLEESENQ